MPARYSAAVLLLAVAVALFACTPPAPKAEPQDIAAEEIKDRPLAATGSDAPSDSDASDENGGADETAKEDGSSKDAPAKPTIIEDFRPDLAHGSKPASYQKYIVLHDTEGDAGPQSVVDWWDGNGNLVAAHFVVGKDGAIVQCVPLDAIAHHAGFGDTGHNEEYGVVDESRDDKRGTVEIGSWAADYGMNSYSVGIEMVHVGGSGDYPQAQLEALDALIASIDGYYGFESRIIDHKAWRTGNSDTSPEFAPYLAAYQESRRHEA